MTINLQTDAISSSQSHDNNSLPGKRFTPLVVVVALYLGLGYVAFMARSVWPFDITAPWSLSGLAGLLGLVVPLGVAHLLMQQRGTRWAHYGLNGQMPVWRILIYSVLATAVIHFSVRYAIFPAVQAVAPGRPDISHLMSLPGNLMGYVFALVIIWITAAFIEELLFRGFLLNETAAVLGGGRGAWVASVLLTGIAFAFGHAYQGLSGFLLTGAIGVVFGGLYLLLNRNLWPLILAHGAIDTYSITQIYLAG